MGRKRGGEWRGGEGRMVVAMKMESDRDEYISLIRKTLDSEMIIS